VKHPGAPEAFESIGSATIESTMRKSAMRESTKSESTMSESTTMSRDDEPEAETRAGGEYKTGS
jgi:hypothetical protein